MRLLAILMLLTLSNLPLTNKPLQTLNIPVATTITSKDTYIKHMKQNNPFNIRTNSANKWVGKLPNNTEPFEKFDTMEHGIRAGLKLLQNYYTLHGLNTVEGIISKFAPAFENNTDLYIKTICTHTGFKRKQVLDLTKEATLLKLAEWIIFVEQGVYINPLKSVYVKYFS